MCAAVSLQYNGRSTQQFPISGKVKYSTTCKQLVGKYGDEFCNAFDNSVKMNLGFIKSSCECQSLLGT